MYSAKHRIKIMSLILSKTKYKAAKDVKRKFDEIMALDKENNLEFRNSIAKEMNRMNGFEVFETEFTESIDMMSARDMRSMMTPEKHKTSLGLDQTQGNEEDDLIDVLNNARDDNILQRDMNDGPVEDSIFAKDKPLKDQNETLPDFGVNLDIRYRLGRN